MNTNAQKSNFILQKQLFCEVILLNKILIDKKIKYKIKWGMMQGGEVG